MTGRARLEIYTSGSQLAALTPSKSILLGECVAIRIVHFRNTISSMFFFSSSLIYLFHSIFIPLLTFSTFNFVISWMITRIGMLLQSMIHFCPVIIHITYINQVTSWKDDFLWCFSQIICSRIMFVNVWLKYKSMHSIFAIVAY